MNLKMENVTQKPRIDTLTLKQILLNLDWALKLKETHATIDMMFRS